MGRARLLCQVSTHALAAGAPAGGLVRARELGREVEQVEREAHGAAERAQALGDRLGAHGGERVERERRLAVAAQPLDASVRGRVRAHDHLRARERRLPISGTKDCSSERSGALQGRAQDSGSCSSAASRVLHTRMRAGERHAEKT